MPSIQDLIFLILLVAGLLLLLAYSLGLRVGKTAEFGPTTAAGATGSRLRKAALYAAFLALGVLFIYGEPLAHWLANLAYGVHDAPNAVNASGAAIAANARVGGWVPVGTATSKIILTVSFYVLSYILPWVVQRVTHPAPTKWAKQDYTSDFEGLPTERKFEVNGRLSLNQSIRFACSVIAACLIN